jgi:hypothetical protein
VQENLRSLHKVSEPSLLDRMWLRQTMQKREVQIRICSEAIFIGALMRKSFFVFSSRLLRTCSCGPLKRSANEFAQIKAQASQLRHSSMERWNPG